MRTSALFNKGNDVTCNCCGKSFGTFLPKGNGIEERQNAMCPNCFSLERTRLLYFYLQRETSVFQDKEKAVLHFAPEQILKKQLKKDRTVYIDADIHPAYASHVFDICKIPYEDNQFHLVICSHVLGHVKEEQLAIKEMQRVVKPNGVALILSLLSGDEKTIEKEGELTAEERLELYGEKDLERLHGNDLKERLERGGFVVEQIDYRNQFSAEEQNRYQLGNGKREMIFVCRKHTVV